MAKPTKTPQQRMQQARTNLVMHNPFFGMLACSIEWVETDKIATMATDGSKIYWNPEFVAKLDNMGSDGKGLQRIVFVQCHEIMHCILDHIFRRGGRIPIIWNYATDYVINQQLIDDRVGIAPDQVLHDPDLYEKGKGKSENIYELIVDEMETAINDQGVTGWADGTVIYRNGQTAFDSLLKPSGSKDDQARQSAEMKVMVASAANAAAQAGKLSAGMKRFVGEVVNAKVDWRTVMRNFVGARAKVDRSYALINTQLLHLFHSHRILLPGRSGETIGEVVVAVDCSGSIYGKIFDSFAAEVIALHAAKKPEKLHIIYFDYEVCGYDVFEPDDTVKLEPKGGGGTRFSPIFKYIADKKIDPVACVVLTDLECHDFGPEPKYPTLWMSTDQPEYSKAPWGRICPITLD